MVSKTLVAELVDLVQQFDLLWSLKLVKRTNLLLHHGSSS
jgi:hypothetical protein